MVGGELSAVAAAHRDLLGPQAVAAPDRFAALVGQAVALGGPGRAPQESAAVARTLVAVSVGLKQLVASREEYLAQLATAIGLLLR